MHRGVVKNYCWLHYARATLSPTTDPPANVGEHCMIHTDSCTVRVQYVKDPTCTLRDPVFTIRTTPGLGPQKVPARASLAEP